VVCGLLGGFVSYRYKRRNLPCHIGGEELTWCVAGEELSEDLTHVMGAGVIEWCTSREDAEQVLAKIQQDPRFRALNVERWRD
jgi:hypothetical protein